MANDRQKQLRKAIHQWAKTGKKKGVSKPGHGRKTNVGDPGNLK